MALWNHGVPRTVNGGVERESFGRSKPWKGGVGGSNIDAVDRRVRRPGSNGRLCALGHRCLGRIIGPSVTLTGLKEIQFFRRVVAVPITSVIGEKVPVSFHPHAVKGVSNTARKHAVLPGRGVDPQQGGVALIGFIADVAC